MMNDIHSKMRIWVESIQSIKLEGLPQDIKMTVDSHMDERHIKIIFKLLLHLSHAADKCNKENYQTGKHIWQLTSVLCSNLKEIPDSNKYLSSLFHIIRCLLAMQLYIEAADVCSYLTHKDLNSSESNASNILMKISYLWHGSTENVFNTFKKQKQYSIDNSELKIIIENEFKIIQLTSNNYVGNLLGRIHVYLEKISVFKNIFDDFIQYIFQYLEGQDIMLVVEDKYTTYYNMIRIIARIVSEKLNENDLQSATELLIKSCKHFEGILLIDKECTQSFVQFKCTCLILIQPTKQLTEDAAKNIQEGINIFSKIIKKYGYTGAAKYTALGLVQILEPLLMYWENCLNAGNKEFLDSGILLQTITLIALLSMIFMNQTIDKCKVCTNEDCTIKTDVYKTVVLKARCATLVSKLSANDLSRDICKPIRKFMEQNMSHLNEMKENNCKSWIKLWSICGTLIYNLGIISKHFYDECSFLFSLLCTSIIYLEGAECKNTYLNFPNPLYSALHRLSNVHYNEGKYREAMTATALHGVLSYRDKDSKAFKMWTNIKHKASSKELNKLSMMTCLKKDKEQIKEIGLDIKTLQYDVIDVYLKEAKGLQEAKVNLTEAFEVILTEVKHLDINPVQYARLIQLLGHHLLHIEQIFTSDHFKEAVSGLKKVKNKSTSILCLEANLEFFIFVNELHFMNKQTQLDIKNIKFALHAPRFSENEECDGRDVVPAYSKINIKEDTRLMQLLLKPLAKWNRCINENIGDIVNSWEPLLTLQILIIVAEYSRLYCYEECELKAWTLAYKLAFELQERSTIIYITGRSISLRQINLDWITLAKEYITELKNSGDENITQTIAIFWIHLADLYFECGEYSEARKLLNDARNLPKISFVENTLVYLLSLDTVLRNCHLYKENIEHKEYTSYIVESLYAMLNLSEELTTKKWMPRQKYLLGYDVLFSSTINLSLRMNSILSFREISAHLVKRLSAAQHLGATIRIAELLKSLCFIDLSRSQLDDCEVKLQGLEHILDIETFQLSMKSKSKQTLEYRAVTPTRILDPLRDIPQNDTSPVLRRKVFNLPNFATHDDCNCNLCQRISYQRLVLASTHIRAQLYALQKYIPAALEHFHGAFKIRQKLSKLENSATNIVSTNSSSKGTVSRKHLARDSSYIIDYVLLLLDYIYFLKFYIPAKKNETMDLAFLAIDICESHNLQSHPIYMSIQEMIYEHRFENIITDSDYSIFTVPSSTEIEVDKLTVQQKCDKEVCSTPVSYGVKNTKLVSIRRNKTPPLLKLSKISMNLSDEEDNDSPGKSENYKPETPAFRSRTIRRKIFENDDTDDEEKTESTSIRQVVDRIKPLVPNISDHVGKIVRDLDAPVTSDVLKKLIDSMECLKVNSNSKQRVLRSRTRSSSENSNMKIQEAIELLEKTTISDPLIIKNSKSDVKVPTIIIDNLESNNINNLHMQKTVNNEINDRSSQENEVLVYDFEKSNAKGSKTTKSTKRTTTMRKKPGIR